MVDDDTQGGCLKSLALLFALTALWVVAVYANVQWGVHPAVVYFGAIGITVAVLMARQERGRR